MAATGDRQRGDLLAATGEDLMAIDTRSRAKSADVLPNGFCVACMCLFSLALVCETSRDQQQL